jgi:hypothetical protein
VGIQNLNLPPSGVHNHQEPVDVSHVGRQIRSWA